MPRRHRPVAALAVLLLVTAASAVAAGNRPPKFPKETVTITYDRKYTILLGQPAVSAQTDKIKLSRPARDPDGDKVRYRWTASNGKITGKGLTAKWVRSVPEPDNVRPGTATVTASDGRGGSGRYRIRSE